MINTTCLLLLLFVVLPLCDGSTAVEAVCDVGWGQPPNATRHKVHTHTQSCTTVVHSVHDRAPQIADCAISRCIIKFGTHTHTHTVLRFERMFIATRCFWRFGRLRPLCENAWHCSCTTTLTTNCSIHVLFSEHWHRRIQSQLDIDFCTKCQHSWLIYKPNHLLSHSSTLLTVRTSIRLCY